MTIDKSGRRTIPGAPFISNDETMKPKNIWTLLLLFGSISGLTACSGETVDRSYRVDFIYKNVTPHPLRMTGYMGLESLDGGKGVASADWDIPADDSLNFSRDITLGYDPGTMYPDVCDSIRLVFDQNRELWYRKSDPDYRNLYESRQEIAVEKYHNRYIHTITPAQYDAATPIDGTDR